MALSKLCRPVEERVLGIGDIADTLACFPVKCEQGRRYGKGDGPLAEVQASGSGRGLTLRDCRRRGGGGQAVLGRFCRGVRHMGTAQDARVVVSASGSGGGSAARGSGIVGLYRIAPQPANTVALPG